MAKASSLHDEMQPIDDPELWTPDLTSKSGPAHLQLCYTDFINFCAIDIGLGQGADGAGVT